MERFGAKRKRQTKKLSIKLKIPTGHPMVLLCSDMKGSGGFGKGLQEQGLAMERDGEDA